MSRGDLRSAPHPLPLYVDVSNEAATKEMAARTIDRFGRIDVLINNAAVFSVVPMNRGRIESIDPQEWDRLMAVNLRGLFFCCRAVLPTMRSQKSGKIVNIASGTVFAGSPGRIHYVTSKAATIGFTRTLAREVGEDNITVNCLAPGNTLSEENPSAQMVKFRESSVGLRSIKRIQVPDDVVGAMLFLASPLSDFMTGQTMFSMMPTIGIITLSNIDLARTTSASATSCGVATSNAPLTLSCCENVICTSPVPGGMLLTEKNLAGSLPEPLKC